MAERDARRALGKRIRQAREYLGLSQEDVAANLRVPRTAISQIENGNRKVDTLELQALARLYQIPVEDLVADSVPERASVQADILARTLRTAATLSEDDRKEVSQFVDFLVARAKTRTKT